MRATLIWIMLVSTASPLLAGDKPVHSHHRADLMPVVTEWLEERMPDLISFYQERHAHPELSLHEAGLHELLGVAELRGTLPERRALWGVVPRSMGWGTDLTAEVEEVVGALLAGVVDELREWGVTVRQKA